MKYLFILLLVTNTAFAQAVKCADTYKEDVKRWTVNHPVVSICIQHRLEREGWEKAYFEMGYVYDDILKAKNKAIKRLKARLKKARCKK